MTTTDIAIRYERRNYIRGAGRHSYVDVVAEVLTLYRDGRLTANELYRMLTYLRVQIDPESPEAWWYGEGGTRRRGMFISDMLGITNDVHTRAAEFARDTRAFAPTFGPTMAEVKAQIESWGDYLYSVTCDHGDPDWHPVEIDLYSRVASRCPVCRTIFDATKSAWTWDAVYIIMSADVSADDTGFIERMSPRSHLPAGYSGEERGALESIAAKFTLTEDDDQYDFGYLADETGGDPIASGYYPYYDYMAEIDNEERTEPDEMPRLGMHRKYVAFLSREEFVKFADVYGIELDPANDYLPRDYEETMGSITELGHLPAISVRLDEGWDDYSGNVVIDMGAYLSFARLQTGTNTAHQITER